MYVCVCSAGGVNQTALGVVSQLLHKQRHRKQEFREFESLMWLHVRKFLNYLQQVNLSRLEICCNRCPDILSYPSDFPTSAYCACAHQYFIVFLTLNNNI